MKQVFVIPAIISIFAALVFSWLYLELLGRLLERTQKVRRASTIRDFSQVQQRIRRKLMKGFVKFDLQIQDLGSTVVRNNYRSFLENYSNQVDSRSERTLKRIIKNKTYLAIAGVLLTFLFSVRNELRLIPISLALTGFSYFTPSLIILINSLIQTRYGKGLARMATFQKGSALSSTRIFRIKFLTSIAVFTICYLFSLIRNTTTAGTLISLFVVIFSFFIPDIWLYNKVSKRREDFADALPEAIDLLSMCTNAGLAFPAAMIRVAESEIQPVSEEFARVNTEVSLGKERIEALREMSERVKVESLHDFVNAVSQVDRFGIPISRALQEQSRELRAKRKARGREKAQKVPIKILGPIMLCFLPCVILIVLTPAIIGVLAVI